MFTHLASNRGVKLHSRGQREYLTSQIQSKEANLHGTNADDTSHVSFQDLLQLLGETFCEFQHSVRSTYSIRGHRLVSLR